MRRTWLAAALTLAAFSLAAVPLTQARYGVAPIGGVPVIVSNGSDFIIAWRRIGEIRVLRASVRHARSLPLPDVVATDALTSFQFSTPPSLAWSGSRFAMVYGRNDGIAVAMLDGDGRVVTPPRAITSGDYPDPNMPQVAWDGQRFLVIYQRTIDADIVYGQFLDAEGRNVGPHFAITKLPDFPSLIRDVHITSNGSTFMIAAASPPEVRVLIVDHDGTVLKQNIIGTSIAPTIAVGTDGRDYLVAWATDGGLVTRAVTADGVALGEPRALAGIGDVSIAWNSNSYLVVSAGGFNTFLERRASDGTVVSGPVILSGGQLPFLASSNGTDVIAFTGGTSFDDISFFGTVKAMALIAGSTLVPLPGLGDLGIASNGASDQDFVAATPSTFATLMMWRETLGTDRSLRIGMLSATNEWRDRDGTPIAAAPVAPPAAAWSGDVFLMAWPESRHVRAVRVDRNGAVIDAVPFDVAPVTDATSSRVSVVWTGQTFVVIDGNRAGGIRATRVDANAHVIDSRIIRPRIGEDFAVEPAAAFNGQAIVVAYDRWSPCPLSIDPCVSGVRVETIAIDSNLQALRSTPAILDVNDSLANPPAIAWSGAGFAVVWPDYYDLKSIALDAIGQPIGRAHSIAPDPKTQHGSAAVSWDRDAFHVVFTRANVPTAIVVSDVRLDSSAAPIAPPKERVLPFDSVGVAAAGSLAFVAERVRDEPYYGAKRITVSPSAEPQTLATPANVKLTGSLLTWDSAPAGAFRIELREGRGQFREIAVVAGSVRSATIDVPFAATVRIRAWSVDGMSEYAEVTTIPAPRRRAAR